MAGDEARGPGSRDAAGRRRRRPTAAGVAGRAPPAARRRIGRSDPVPVRSRVVLGVASGRRPRRRRRRRRRRVHPRPEARARLRRSREAARRRESRRPGPPVRAPVAVGGRAGLAVAGAVARRSRGPGAGGAGRVGGGRGGVPALACRRGRLRSGGPRARVLGRRLDGDGVATLSDGGDRRRPRGRAAAIPPISSVLTVLSNVQRQELLALPEHRLRRCVYYYFFLPRYSIPRE